MRPHTRAHIQDAVYSAAFLAPVCAPLALVYARHAAFDAPAPLSWALDLLVAGPLTLFARTTPDAQTPDFLALCALPTFMLAMAALALRLAHELPRVGRILVWPVLLARHAVYIPLAGGVAALSHSPLVWWCTILPLALYGVCAALIARTPTDTPRLFHATLGLLTFEHLGVPLLASLTVTV